MYMCLVMANHSGVTHIDRLFYNVESMDRTGICDHIYGGENRELN